jgi:prepilin-type N-terminal cleavage/methylation domain-containing protein
MLKRRGFTLLEVLVSMAIGLVLVGFAAYATSHFIENRALEAVSDTLVSYLRSAEARALQSEGNVSHGVSTAGGKITLFRGASYASRQTVYDTVLPYDGYIQFSGISEVVFAKQTGLPSATGTITVTNGIRSTTITVYSTGAVSW